MKESDSILTICFHSHKDHFKGIYNLWKLISFVQVNHVSFKKTCAVSQAQGY